MTKTEIMEFEGKYIDDETFEEIELSEDVESVENGGGSGINPDWVWYIVHFTNGEEISIYG